MMETNTFCIKLRSRGQLKNPADVQQLITETEDICRSHGWPCQIWDKDWSKPAGLTINFTGEALNFDGHAPLKGITFSIGQSESVWLTFQPDGILQSLFTLTDSAFTAEASDIPWQRVKTCYDGAATHIAVCKLFRYLSGKYFDVFEVRDESGYWDYNDDARFTGWIEHLLKDHRQLEEELAFVEQDSTLSQEQKSDTFYRLMKEFGEKYRVGG